MEEKAVVLDIGLSKAIKGIAIIFMVTHHAFGFPAWYIQGIDYSSATILGLPLHAWITNSTQLCVGIFAFLTGWAYFFNKKPTLVYSLKKIVSFVKYYWFILFLIFIPAARIFGNYVPTVKDVLFNIFAAKSNLVCFAWYVYFYIFVMLTLPFVIKCFNGRILWDFFFAVGSCVLLYNLVSHVVLFRDYVTSGLLNCLFWYPCVLTGYLFAKHDLFTRLQKHFGHPYKILYAFTLLFVMGCRLKWQTLLGVNLDVLYIPAAVFSLVGLLSGAVRAVRATLEFLGGHSMNIWFLHSIFFTIMLRPVFEPIAYLPRNPVLVVLWFFLLCLPFSMAIHFIFRQQEKLFRKLKEKRRTESRVS